MQNEVTTDSEAGMKKASSSCSDKATNNGATTRGKTSRQTISRRTFLGAAAVMGVQVALFGLAGCAPQESGDAAEAYKPGTYTGKADGKFNTIEVEADFSETAIKDIRIINHEETRRIAAPAIEMIPQRIIEHQGLGVDTVTGATLTSLGIINATTDCVKQAGGSVSALQKRGSVEPTGEQIELEADAVVVGAGASGMGAALASAQSGARVIVLEKNSNIGGNCLVSGGYLEYLSAPDAARPEMTEELHRYVEEVLGSEIAAASDPAIVEKVRQQYEEYKATGSSKLFDSELFYSLDIAVTSGEGLPVEVYMPLAHNLSVLNDWMTELNFSWATPLHPITGYAYPRWSNPTEGICGEGYFDFFDTVLEGEGLGVEVMLATAAQDLITEGGSVVGVTACAEDGTIYTIRTPKVILASGGFSGNPDLLREYNTLWDYPKGNLPTTNVNGHTGDGITLARKIGAQVKDMDNQMLFPFNDPITFSADNVAGTFGDSPVVNEGGKRFVDETTDRFTIAAALMKQTNSMCYFISDSESVMFYETSPSEETLLRRGQLFKGNTLEELGQQMGCDPKEFAEELKRFNDFVAAGNDTDFGRYIFSEISAVDTPPFYAAPATWAAHITIGGLDVDETNFAVRNENGSSIPGLYACGEVRNSICGVASIADGVAAGKAIFTR